MMHAFLFVGKTGKDRLEAIEKKLKPWHIEPFDRILVENDLPSLGISEIRELERRLKLKPYESQFTVVIIKDANKLTVQAQQALLKTLEEPPPHARLILETASREALLPTILSRCEIIDLGVSSEYAKEDLLRCFETLEQLSRGSLGTRLIRVDGLATSKEGTLAWIDCALAAGREALLVNKISPKLLRGLLTARSQIAGNVNPKLALDNLFLNL